MSDLTELMAKYKALRVAAGLRPDLPPPPDLAEVMVRQRDRVIAQWHRERALVRKIITDAGGTLSGY